MSTFFKTGARWIRMNHVYQVGNLVLRLVCGKPAVSRSAPALFRRQDGEPLEIESPRFRDRLQDGLASAAEKNRGAFASGNDWLSEKVQETTSVRISGRETGSAVGMVPCSPSQGPTEELP